MSHHVSSPTDALPPFLKPVGLALGVVGMVQNWNVNDIFAAMSAIGSLCIGVVAVGNFALNLLASWRKARAGK